MSESPSEPFTSKSPGNATTRPFGRLAAAQDDVNGTAGDITIAQEEIAASLRTEGDLRSHLVKIELDLKFNEGRLIALFGPEDKERKAVVQNERRVLLDKQRAKEHSLAMVAGEISLSKAELVEARQAHQAALTAYWHTFSQSLGQTNSIADTFLQLLYCLALRTSAASESVQPEQLTTLADKVQAADWLRQLEQKFFSSGTECAQAVTDYLV
jgi:hypothetical protein